jgi:hypothetical protein
MEFYKFVGNNFKTQNNLTWEVYITFIIEKTVV